MTHATNYLYTKNRCHDGGIYLVFLNIEDDASFKDIHDVFSFMDLQRSPSRIERTLHIVCFITPYHKKDEVIPILRKAGYSLHNDHNELVCMKHNKDLGIYFMLMDNGCLVILSNARKSDQIPKRIHSIFEDVEDVYNLSIPPKLMMDILGEQIGEKKKGIITNFHGKYVPGSGKKSRFRPDIERNASYHGNDGYETLKEWSNYYGIFPNNVTVHFHNGLQIKLDSKGIFSVFRGSISEFKPVMFRIIDYNQMIKENIQKNSKYELMELGKGDGEIMIGLEYPWNIRFDNVLSMSRYDRILKENISNHNISYISKILNDDSRFLLANVVDDRKNVKMEIRIKDNDIMIYPVERSDIGSNLRLFDIITGNIDIRAEVR